MEDAVTLARNVLAEGEVGLDLGSGMGDDTSAMLLDLAAALGLSCEVNTQGVLATAIARIHSDESEMRWMEKHSGRRPGMVHVAEHNGEGEG